MINIVIKKRQDIILGFIINGHAGYEDSGKDIVCSAISILAINAVNSIEKFTDAGFTVEADEKERGYLEFCLSPNWERDHDAGLLLKSLVNGLYDIKNEYESYINIYDEEVQ